MAPPPAATVDPVVDQTSHAFAAKAIGEGTLARLAVVATAGSILAVIDLDVKLAVPTPVWAYHHRPGSWFAICFVALVGAAVLTRVPSPAVTAGAAIMSGGILGNVISARWYDDSVPNPIIVFAGNRGGIAFNVADVFTLAGIMLLTGALVSFTIAHRDRLWNPHRLDRRVRDLLDRRRSL
jgi:hypothetical protein